MHLWKRWVIPIKRRFQFKFCSNFRPSEGGGQCTPDEPGRGSWRVHVYICNVLYVINATLIEILSMSGRIWDLTKVSAHWRYNYCADKGQILVQYFYVKCTCNILVQFPMKKCTRIPFNSCENSFNIKKLLGRIKDIYEIKLCCSPWITESQGVTSLVEQKIQRQPHCFWPLVALPQCWDPVRNNTCNTCISKWITHVFC